MMYEALPIPATNGKNWGVYATYRKTELPPKLELRTRHRADARRYAKDMCQDHTKYPARSYTWRWIRLDDDVNQWWKNNDRYAQANGWHNPYREGGRAVVIDFGDGEERRIPTATLWPT